MVIYSENLSLQSCVKTRPVLHIALSRSVTFAEGDDNAEDSKRQCGSRDEWREMSDRRLILGIRSMIPPSYQFFQFLHAAEKDGQDVMM